MTKYFIGVNYTKQKRFLRHSKKLIILPILLLFLAAIIIVVDSYINHRLADAPSQTTAPSVSTVAPNVNIFTTDFFQFQADKEWHYITNESTQSKFVYRRTNGKIVSADLTIYINSTPPDLEATRILPVELNESSKILKAQKISDHCRENIPIARRNNIGQEMITLKLVKFMCDVDGTLYSAMVGKVNGTTTMKFTRTGGSIADYTIYYQDLRAIPLNSELEDIINTFQIR